MFWMACAAVLFAIAGFPTVLLMERKLRQAKAAARLGIEGDCGIVEEGFVRIGGIEQWIGIRGEDRSNPVLLMLHGGPGCSYSIFTPRLRSWEKHFTVVQWDQRGGSRTGSRNGARNLDGITFEQLTRDAIDVVEYLLARMGKERLFLLASSIGSTFGILVALRRPDLLYAYVGTDQNVGMRRGHEEEFQETLARLRALELWKGSKALEHAGADPEHWTAEDFNAVAQWTMRSDPQGYRRTIKLLKDAVWYAPGWRLKDIRAFVSGMRHTLRTLLPEIVRYDAWKQGLRFEVPFFIFQGEHDVLTTPRLAKVMFDDVVAPMKRMALIPDAGHFAAFLQPDEFLRELLVDVRPLAELGEGERALLAVRGADDCHNNIFRSSGRPLQSPASSAD